MATGTELGARAASSPDRPRSRKRRVVVRLSLAGVLVLLLTVGGLWLAEYSLYRQVGEVDVDLSVLGDRPAGSDAVDVAVIGTVHGRWVSQLLLHIEPDRRSASVVWIPDARIVVLPEWHSSMPEQPSGADLVQVAARIERATGQRLDHVAILDWRAVAQLTDQIDGLDLWIGPEGADARWPEALHVTGESVLGMVDRDPCLGGPAGARAEARRIRREQALLEAVLDQTLHQELVYNPFALYGDLDAQAENLTVDSGWSQREMVELVVSLRHLRSRAITFETAPGLGRARPAATAC
jgi:anionic cell wall polymer biosynthesis LytR-Cps2A-Psr (LCP) family protein